MFKWCFNYESGKYEHISRNGFSLEQGGFVLLWDDSEYRQEEEERQQEAWRQEEEDD